MFLFQLEASSNILSSKYRAEGSVENIPQKISDPSLTTLTRNFEQCVAIPYAGEVYKINYYLKKKYETNNLTALFHKFPQKITKFVFIFYVFRRNNIYRHKPMISFLNNQLRPREDSGTLTGQDCRANIK